MSLLGVRDSSILALGAALILGGAGSVAAGPVDASAPKLIATPAAPAAVPLISEITLVACGIPLSPGIHQTWLETGGPEGYLGCAIANEEEAPPSPFGTTGRIAWFAEGVIVWHRDRGLAGRGFAVPACLGLAYEKLAGPASYLGYPVGDYHDTSGYLTAEFEGGALYWNNDGPVECDVRKALERTSPAG